LERALNCLPDLTFFFSIYRSIFTSSPTSRNPQNALKIHNSHIFWSNMKITIASVLISLALASEISAGLISRPSSHHVLARRLSRQKRCIRTFQPSGDASSSTYTSTSTSDAPAASDTAAQTNVQDNNNDGNSGQQQSTGGGGGGGGSSQPGTISIAGYSAPCGDPNASCGYMVVRIARLISHVPIYSNFHSRQWS
jgi:hypothetical protein